MGVTDGVVRAVAFSKGSVVHCPLHPSPPNRASPVPACNGSGLSRARSNCTHNTRSKSLCRVLRSVPCASRARFGSQAYRRRSVQFKARVRSFGKPMSTRGKPLRRCAEHNVSSSTPAPVRVKALYTHHQLHTTIRGPSRASQRMPAACLQGQKIRRVRRYACPSPAQRCVAICSPLRRARSPGPTERRPRHQIRGPAAPRPHAPTASRDPVRGLAIAADPVPPRAEAIRNPRNSLDAALDSLAQNT